MCKYNYATIVINKSVKAILIIYFNYTYWPFSII